MKNDSDLTTQWTANYDWRLFFNTHYDSGLGESTEMDIFESNNHRVAFGSWSFDSDDPDGIAADVTKLSFVFYLEEQGLIISGIYPLATRACSKYIILRLKNDELWLEHTDSVQNVYVIKFHSN
jgi:hypothetical protein